MSNKVVDLKNLTNDDLKKCLALQIALEDWTDECSKCSYPKLIHKNLHRTTRSPRCIEQELELMDKGYVS